VRDKRDDRAVYITLDLMDIPAPDQARPPSLPYGRELVTIVYSEDEQVRAVIMRDAQNLFRVHPERWDVSDLTVIGYAFWSPWGAGDSITDSLETATQIARELLDKVPRTVVVPDTEE
jgi:hypothetical protein